MTPQSRRHRELPTIAAGLRTGLLLIPALLLSRMHGGVLDLPADRSARGAIRPGQLRWAYRGHQSLPTTPFEGISIGVALSPLDLRLRTPRGVHAHLDGDTVVVSGHTAQGNVDVTMQLKTAAEASDGGSLAEVRFEERHDSSWQPGVPTADIQIDAMTTGTIRLPALTIDGVAWPAQSLPFTRKVYPEVMKTTTACPAPP